MEGDFGARYAMGGRRMCYIRKSIIINGSTRNMKKRSARIARRTEGQESGATSYSDALV